MLARRTEADEARAFLRLAHEENGWTGLDARLRDLGPGFDLSARELAYGCRVAWRNSTRCVGRSYWRYLNVRDLRHVQRAPDVFRELVAHLDLAWNGGNLVPTISVFGPDVRVLSDQLIRYADDPKNAALAHFLRGLGWRARGDRFEVLPLAIRDASGVHLFELPASAVREVELTHPDHPAFAELGLRWHALPVVSDMRLEIAGISYPCAPFNGWYLGTEIGARNLADEDRYDVLPDVARVLGLDTSRARTLWKDRALVELNVAVLHSFDRAGVKISDHHAVTRHFVRFEERERAAGRAVYGRWSWLVPPLSPATAPVYHRSYEDRELTPNFFPQARAWEAVRRCPFH